MISYTQQTPYIEIANPHYVRLIFAYDMGLGGRNFTPSVHTVHRVLASFHYENGWRVSFFEADRRRTQLPRRAFCHDDETLLAFLQRAGGAKDSDTRFYLEQGIKRRHGDVTLYLTDQQYDLLRMRR